MKMEIIFLQGLEDLAGMSGLIHIRWQLLRYDK